MGLSLAGEALLGWVQADGLLSAHTALCFLGISRKVGGGIGTKFVEQLTHGETVGQVPQYLEDHFGDTCSVWPRP